MKIGFMQGRLSPIYRNRIQSFPWNNWKEEFQIANRLGINLMEWTIDSYKFHRNPIFTKKGREKVNLLKKKNKIKIESLTADYFMEKPFWKKSNQKNKKLQNNFWKLIKSCKILGIKKIVIPLVDGGSFKSEGEKLFLINYLNNEKQKIKKNSVKIIFETDMKPKDVIKFITQLDSRIFGINYDIGNSAGLGFKLEEEIKVFGKHILNVHLKDKKKKGKTIKFGKGSANFKKLFFLLKKNKYKGNFIIQSARAKKNYNQVNEFLYNFNFIKEIYEKK